MAGRSPFPPGSPAESLSKGVLQKFLQWRRGTPIHLRRIPSELWAAAMELAVASNVYQAARFLGLDSSQLKKRVLAAYGPDSPAFSRQRQGPTPANPSSGLSTRPPMPFMNPLGIKNPPLPSNDGFIEATLSGVPPILAEIRTPSGYTLRLYSSDTERLVRAFVQP